MNSLEDTASPGLERGKQLWNSIPRRRQQESVLQARRWRRCSEKLKVIRVCWWQSAQKAQFKGQNKGGWEDGSGSHVQRSGGHWGAWETQAYWTDGMQVGLMQRPCGKAGRSQGCNHYMFLLCAGPPGEMGAKLCRGLISENMRPSGFLASYRSKTLILQTHLEKAALKRPLLSSPCVFRAPKWQRFLTNLEKFEPLESQSFTLSRSPYTRRPPGLCLRGTRTLPPPRILCVFSLSEILSLRKHGPLLSSLFRS